MGGRSVGAGRKEIYEVWWEANQTGNSDLLKQAAMGGLQLMFNNKQRSARTRRCFLLFLTELTSLPPAPPAPPCCHSPLIQRSVERRTNVT